MTCARANTLMIAIALALLLATVDTGHAQPPGDRGPGPENQPGSGLGSPPRGPGMMSGPGARGGFGMRGGPGMMNLPGMEFADLLRQDAVRKELELLDDQVNQLEKLGEEIRDNLRYAFTKMRQDRESGGNNDPNRIREVFESVQKKTKDRLAEILLPHQMKRLQQLQFQLRLRGGGFAMLSPGVGEKLGITDEQREQLREKGQEIELELRKKIAELRRQAQEDLLSLLTSEQQAQYRELVGEPFEFPQQRPPQRRTGAPQGPNNPQGAGGFQEGRGFQRGRGDQQGGPQGPPTRRTQPPQ